MTIVSPMLYSLSNNQPKALSMSAYIVPSEQITLPQYNGMLITHVYQMRNAQVADRKKAFEAPIGSIDHVGCGGMNARKVSYRKIVLFCPECGLRLEFPCSVKTFGDVHSYYQKRR